MNWIWIRLIFLFNTNLIFTKDSITFSDDIK